MAPSSVFLSDPDVTLYHGDVLAVLHELAAESVDCVVTSPPYWGLRSYLADEHDDKPKELGLEPTPEQYVERMVEVFREIRRVLAPHGSVYLNLGDSYSNKQRQMMPARVALALQADGWWLRSEIVWSKRNPMPASVTDRPTDAHEMIYLLSKQPRYFFDQEAVREPAEWAWWGTQTNHKHEGQPTGAGAIPKASNRAEVAERMGHKRNIRSVWQIATQPYPEAHFATFPEELARRCIAAGCPEQVCRVCGKARERMVERELEATSRTSPPNKGRVVPRADGEDKAAHLTHDGWVPNRKLTVSTLGFTDCGHSDYRPGVTLDPFIGSGTVAHVARKLGRHALGIDLNESYLELAAGRLQQQSLFAGAV